MGHPDYEVTGGSIVFKGQNLLDMEPEERSLAGLFMSFQSPVEIPGVSNMDFLNMAFNARKRKLGQPELDPIQVPCQIRGFALFLTCCYVPLCQMFPVA